MTDGYATVPLFLRRCRPAFAVAAPMALVLAAMLLAPRSAAAQRIVVTPIVDLIGGEALNIPEPLDPGMTVPLPDGGWLYSGYQEQWTWAQFNAAGTLVRAPGRRWSGGGPGEFRNVMGAFPLAGDTLLVIEPYMATRVLRDGTYIDRRFISVQPRSPHWTWHDGAFWVGGWDPRARDAIALLRLGRSGAERVLVPVRQQDRPADSGSVSGIPVAWNGALWVMERRTLRMRRIDPGSGRVLEVWEPAFGGDVGAAYALHVAAGPHGTLIFRVQARDRMWVVFYAARNRVLAQSIPDEMRGVYMLDSKYARSFSWTDDPVEYYTGVRIYEYHIEGWPRRE